MISDDFYLNNTSVEKVLKIMTNAETSKTAGVDGLSSRFLNDGINTFCTLQSLSLTGSLLKCLQSWETEAYF